MINTRSYWHYSSHQYWYRPIDTDQFLSTEAIQIRKKGRDDVQEEAFMNNVLQR